MGNKLIFIFLDGVGMGSIDDFNPFIKASMPTLFNLMGGKLTNATNIAEQNLLVKGIDACLGIKGIPQSATGQASLFTGFNTQAMLGYHLPAYPNNELISLINKRSIFKFAKENHINSIFANSYSDEFFDASNQNKWTYSVTTYCVLAAQLKFHTMNDLIENNAVHWDITNSTLQNTHKNRISEIAPFDAGQNLKNLALHHDLVLFECFLPDLIGHKKDMHRSILFFEMFDAFLRGVLFNKPQNVNILISSDHGNIEDLSIGSHTRNLVPLICIGNLANNFSEVHAIDEIFSTIFSKIFNIV